MDVNELAACIGAEYERIGLDKFTSPSGGLAGTMEGLGQYLERLRALPVGATWRDVDPDIPAHWDLNDEETWTARYEPYGDWDYQQPPAGSAVMVGYRNFGESAHFNALVERAKAAGFLIYGASIQYTRESAYGPRSTNESNWGVIVLPLGAPQEMLYTLADWAHHQLGVLSARPDRHEDTVYHKPDP